MTSEPRWGGRRSSAAGRKTSVTSRMCSSLKEKWDRKYFCVEQYRIDTLLSQQ